MDQGRESDLIILNAGDVLDNALAVFTAACLLTNLLGFWPHRELS